MIDPVDLMLLQCFQDLGIQGLGRRQIVAEGLFDHHPAPLAVLFGYKTGGTKVRDRRCEEAVGDGKIEQVIPAGRRGFVQPGEVVAELEVGAGVVQIALEIAHAVAEPLPCLLVDGVDVKLAALPSEIRPLQQ